MLNVFVISFFCVFFHLSAGKIFSKCFNINSNNFYDLSLSSIFGLIVLSFIALFLNFFFPLKQQINTIVLILIFVACFFTNTNFIKTIFTLSILKYVLFSSIGISLLVILSKIYTPDGALYHYPYVNILNENKIILGVSNIHHRFGHISIMQYLSAAHFNYFFGINGIVLPLSAIAIYSIIFFISNIIINQNLSISKIFAILIIIFVCWKMNRYGEYGNDAPGHFIVFVIILIYLNYLENFFNTKDSIFYLISFFSIFVFLNKISLIFILFIPLLLVDKKIIKNLINQKTFFLFFFIFFWILKNILTTGCMIYPSPMTCFQFSWTNIDNISNVYEVSIGTEAWAKDWTGQKENVLPFNEFIKNFIWIEFWLNNHFKKILEIIIPYLIFIVIFILFLIKIKKEKLTLDQNFNTRAYLPIFGILIFGIIFWFFKTPVFRFGYSYIISFFALFFSIILKYNIKNHQIVRETKFSLSIIFIAIFILFSKQFVRIYKNFNIQYLNYPWPKYYSYSTSNDPIKLTKVIKNNVFLYYLSENDYCFYNKSPCTSVNVDMKLKKKINSYGYKIFYFKE